MTDKSSADVAEIELDKWMASLNEPSSPRDAAVSASPVAVDRILSSPTCASPLDRINVSCLLCQANLGVGRAPGHSSIMCIGDGAIGHAGACLKCFAAPHQRSPPWALTQLAARAQSSTPSQTDYGDGLPATQEGETLCYVTYLKGNGELICNECYATGTRGGAVSDTARQVILEPADEMPGLLKDLQARADDRMISQIPAATEVATMHRFLRLSALEDTAPAKLDLLLTHLLKVPTNKLIESAAKTHLKWNPPAECFDSPDGWEDFVGTLQRIFEAEANQGAALAQKIAPPAILFIPLPQEMRRFAARSEIILEANNAESVAEVNKLASGLSPQAKGVLACVGYSDSERAFRDSDPRLLTAAVRQAAALLNPETHCEPQAAGATQFRAAAVSTTFEPLQHLPPQPLQDKQGPPRNPLQGRPARPLQETLGQAAAALPSTFNWDGVTEGLIALGLDPDTGARHQQIIEARHRSADSRALPVLDPRAAMSLNTPSTPAAMTEASQLLQLFENHLQASDKERTSGNNLIPTLALTLHVTKESLREANLARVSHQALTRSLDSYEHLEDGSLMHRPRLPGGATPSALVTYLPSFSEDDLKAYFATTKQYVSEKAPDLQAAYKVLRTWVTNKDKTVFNAFGTRAPDDAGAKTANLEATLGRLFMARHMVMRHKTLTLAAIDELLRQYCLTQPALSPSAATKTLLHNLGFTPAKTDSTLRSPNSSFSSAARTPISSVQAQLDVNKAWSLKTAWQSMNSKTACANCQGSGHNAGECFAMPRRRDLPCQLCYGFGGDHREPLCPGAHAISPHHMAEFARLQIILWEIRTGARSAAPHTGGGAASRPTPTGGRGGAGC